MVTPWRLDLSVVSRLYGKVNDCDITITQKARTGSHWERHSCHGSASTRDAGWRRSVLAEHDITRPEAVRMIIQEWMAKHQVLKGE